MTDWRDLVDEGAAERARRRRAEQGLPPRVEDEDALRQIAALLVEGDPGLGRTWAAPGPRKPRKRP